MGDGMNRRDWLKKTSITLAGGLILGDAALELFEKLTHRKVFALGGLSDQHLWGLSTSTYPDWSAVTTSTSLQSITGSTYEIWERLYNGQYAHRREFLPDNKDVWGSVVHYPDVPILPLTAKIGRYPS